MIEENVQYVLLPIETIDTIRDVCTGIAYHYGPTFPEVDGTNKVAYFYVHGDYPVARVCEKWYVLLNADQLRCPNDYQKEMHAASEYLISHKDDRRFLISTMKQEQYNPEIQKGAKKAFLSWTGCAIFQ